jgi:hypothetical protein
MFTNDLENFGLSDKIPVPLEQTFWQKTVTLWGIIANSYYERSIAKITTAVNWNDGLWAWVSGRITWQEVATIINAYGNLAEKGAIPTYELRNIPGKNIKALSESDRKKLIADVSRLSGMNQEYCERVLNQLYWYTVSGDIAFDGLLRPGNLTTYAKNNVIPESLKETSYQGKNIFTGIGLPSWTGKGLIVLAIVGVGAYGLMQVNKSAEIIKG